MGRDKSVNDMQSYAFNLQNETIKRKTKDNMKEDKDN